MRQYSIDDFSHLLATCAQSARVSGRIVTIEVKYGARRGQVNVTPHGKASLVGDTRTHGGATHRGACWGTARYIIHVFACNPDAYAIWASRGKTGVY